MAYGLTDEQLDMICEALMGYAEKTELNVKPLQPIGDTTMATKTMRTRVLTNKTKDYEQDKIKEIRNIGERT